MEEVVGGHHQHIQVEEDGYTPNPPSGVPQHQPSGRSVEDCWQDEDCREEPWDNRQVEVSTRQAGQPWVWEGGRGFAYKDTEHEQAIPDKRAVGRRIRAVPDEDVGDGRSRPVDEGGGSILPPGLASTVVEAALCAVLLRPPDWADDDAAPSGVHRPVH